MDIKNRKLLFLRHFKTSLNIQNKITGQLDVDVIKYPTEIFGLNKIENNLEIFLSPLKRCKQTLEYIERIKGTDFTNVTILEELKERNFGDWENKLKSETLKNYKSFYKNDKFDYKLTPPNGESYNSMLERANKIIKKINCTRSNEQILICSHNHFMKVLINQLYNINVFPSFNFLSGIIYDKEQIIDDSKN